MNTISSVPIDVRFFGENRKSGENPQTVPPLYTLNIDTLDESQSLGNREGRVWNRRNPEGRESEDLLEI